MAQAEQHYQQILSEWQALPPPPVLPPRGKLEKISGRLEAFSRIRCKASFYPHSYSNAPGEKLTAGEKGVAGAAAIAIGSPALAALAIKDEDAPLPDADYVQGMINGRPFAGWVGFTHLAVGDEVELAAEWQEDHYQVYAIAVPAQRIVSVCPRCDHGRYAEAIISVKLTVYWILSLAIIFSLIRFLISDGVFWNVLINSIIDDYNDFYLFTTLMVGTISPLIGFFFIFPTEIL
ncbi:putative type VI secretion system effector [Brenneria goodwinii]|uniref:putative type VI secretion system effector n=1 Tax=Brenneria goodwinii TaxID=1109412 RepID=UPI001C922473|nr:putative type VI secretion system effector [Brenneria goodwinii]